MEEEKEGEGAPLSTTQLFFWSPCRSLHSEDVVLHKAVSSSSSQPPGYDKINQTGASAGAAKVSTPAMFYLTTVAFKVCAKSFPSVFSMVPSVCTRFLDIE